MIDKTTIGQIKKLSKYTEPEYNTEVVSQGIASSKEFEENSQLELELELVQKQASPEIDKPTATPNTSQSPPEDQRCDYSYQRGEAEGRGCRLIQECAVDDVLTDASGQANNVVSEQATKGYESEDHDSVLTAQTSASEDPTPKATQSKAFLTKKRQVDIGHGLTGGGSSEQQVRYQLRAEDKEHHQDNSAEKSVNKAYQGTQSAPKGPIKNEVDVNNKSKQPSISPEKSGCSRKKNSRLSRLCSSRAKGRKQRLAVLPHKIPNCTRIQRSRSLEYGKTEVVNKATEHCSESPLSSPCLPFTSKVEAILPGTIIARSQVLSNTFDLEEKSKVNDTLSPEPATDVANSILTTDKILEQENPPEKCAKTANAEVVPQEIEPASTKLDCFNKVNPVLSPSLPTALPASSPTATTSTSKPARSPAAQETVIIPPSVANCKSHTTTTWFKMLLGMLLGAWMIAGTYLVGQFNPSSTKTSLGSTSRPCGPWRGTWITWSQGTDSGRETWELKKSPYLQNN